MLVHPKMFKINNLGYVIMGSDQSGLSGYPASAFAYGATNDAQNQINQLMLELGYTDITPEYARPTSFNKPEKFWQKMGGKWFWLPRWDSMTPYNKLVEEFPEACTIIPDPVGVQAYLEYSSWLFWDDVARREKLIVGGDMRDNPITLKSELRWLDEQIALKESFLKNTKGDNPFVQSYRNALDELIGKREKLIRDPFSVERLVHWKFQNFVNKILDDAITCGIIPYDFNTTARSANSRFWVTGKFMVGEETRKVLMVCDYLTEIAQNGGKSVPKKAWEQWIGAIFGTEEPIKPDSLNETIKNPFENVDDSDFSLDNLVSGAIMHTDGSDMSDYN